MSSPPPSGSLSVFRPPPWGMSLIRLRSRLTVYTHLAPTEINPGQALESEVFTVTREREEEVENRKRNAVQLTQRVVIRIMAG